jgi:hypothetical protein
LGLVCYERVGDGSQPEPVPACKFGGTGIVLEDYCTVPWMDNQLVLMAWPQEGYPLPEGLLGMCQGDCAEDDDCAVRSAIASLSFTASYSHAHMLAIPFEY